VPSLSTPPILNPLLKGMLSWLPGTQRVFRTPTAGGATGSALYCYGVWLKHLCLLWQHGMREMPHTIVEIGPGTSLGTGLAALLCGAERYIGIDNVRHASAATCRAVLRELITLLQARAPRPAKGWPDYDAQLDERGFPGGILTEARLAAALAPRRLEWIARAVDKLDSPAQDARLVYLAADDAEPLGAGEADLVFSHVVLNVADRVERIYARFARWLRPGGWTSHQIDFTSLGLTPEWNGHLQYDDALWRLISGRRPFFAKRERLSAHLGLLRENGLHLIAALRGERLDGISRAQLGPGLRALSDEDLNCSTAFLIAQKRG
jgi:SAM-dependent methyltransferase